MKSILNKGGLLLLLFAVFTTPALGITYDSKKDAAEEETDARLYYRYAAEVPVLDIAVPTEVQAVFNANTVKIRTSLN